MQLSVEKLQLTAS